MDRRPGGRVYLPESWTQDQERCQAAGVPEEVEFATKPELALERLRQARRDRVGGGEKGGQRLGCAVGSPKQAQWGEKRPWFSQAGLSPSLGPWARYDLPLILRMIAPCTNRSRRAMVRGPSNR